VPDTEVDGVTNAMIETRPTAPKHHRGAPHDTDSGGW
jgi:hypothetical protein